MIKRRISIGLKVGLLRIALALVVMLALLSGREKLALGLFFITALIAFGDSYISKKRNLKSLLKSIVDYFANRLLVNLTALALAINGSMHWWVLAVFAIRDFFTIVIGTTLIYRDFRREFNPTVLGKINIFFQIVTVLTFMMGQPDPILVWITVVITVASGIEALFKCEFRLVKKETDIGKFRLFRHIKFADTLTMLNVLFGFMAIVFSIRGFHTTASIMMVLSVISDYLDGKLSRVMGESSGLGKELDSLADTISFGVAPAIFAFSLIQTPLAAVSFTVYLFCGILRLARFNLTSLKGEYQGMPITLNGIIIPAIFFLDVAKIYYPYIYLVLGVLMISSIRVKKLF
ncbi:CDP-diacylglycerol--serine O-phosphatidyltransferase [Candidatus Woesearchaeota archaeon]|nr:CDP-diacylglycerol--serine O-phosphatidyltransferase [Candidatus Woesearchaeota archaeon]